MWVVLRYKQSEIGNLKNDLISRIKDVVFYNPKIKLNYFLNNKRNLKTKNLLEGYLFCQSKVFESIESKNIIKNLKGMQYILSGSKKDQRDIENFISICKQHEDDQGFIKQSFFDIKNKTKCYFLSGPFAKIVFDIIEETKKIIKVRFKNIDLIVPKNSSNLLHYQS